jgi:hypothetical protein
MLEPTEDKLSLGGGKAGDESGGEDGGGGGGYGGLSLLGH